MKLRWIAFIGFLIVIVLMAFLRRRDGQEGGYVAIRDLPVNTRINSGVWFLRRGDSPAASWQTPPEKSLVGYYLKEPIKKDALIHPENLSDGPALTFGADSIPYISNLSEAGSLSAYINTDTQISVCDQDAGTCAGPYRVKALIGKLDSQLVLLMLKKQEYEEVHKLKKPTLRVAALP